MTSPRGFTIVELLMSAAITLAIMGIALVVVGQGRDALDQGSMGLDAAQRLRAGLDVVGRDLRNAGAGPESITEILVLPHAMPVVEPLAPAASGPGAGLRFRSVRVTMAPANAAHGRLTTRALPGDAVRLRAPPDCPDVPACGFREGMAVAIFDGSGAFDRGIVTGVDPAMGTVAIAPAVSREYAADAMLTEVLVSTFVVDEDADGDRRLMRTTAAGAVQPVVDHVVSFEVEVLGEAAPPRPGRTPESPPTYGPVAPATRVDDPRDAWPVGENCTITLGTDGRHTARLPPLGGAGELVVLPASVLVDGPWCSGAAGTSYDADLFRIRRLDLRIRVEASAARFRGPAGALFARGGYGRATTWSPDLELALSVSPPNTRPR